MSRRTFISGAILVALVVALVAQFVQFRLLVERHSELERLVRDRRQSPTMIERLGRLEADSETERLLGRANRDKTEHRLVRVEEEVDEIRALLESRVVPDAPATPVLRFDQLTPAERSLVNPHEVCKRLDDGRIARLRLIGPEGPRPLTDEELVLANDLIDLRLEIREVRRAAYTEKLQNGDFESFSTVDEATQYAGKLTKEGRVVGTRPHVTGHIVIDLTDSHLQCRVLEQESERIKELLGVTQTAFVVSSP